MKLIKRISLIGVLAIFGLAFFVSSVEAKTEEATQIDCFDYYKFGSVNINITAKKNWFIPKQKVEFKGFLSNNNEYPLVNGTLFVRIGQKGPQSFLEGNYVIDEFVAVENFSIGGKKNKEISFYWTVPVGTPEGRYQADYYFMSGKELSISGLAFSHDIVGSSYFFEIKKNRNKNSFLNFELKKTKVNEKKFSRTGEFIINAKEKINIEQPIKNNFDEEIQVKIKREVYRWDSLNPDSLSETDEEIIKIPAKSTKILNYSFKEIEYAATYIRLTAEYGDQEAITGIRVLADIANPKIAFSGLNEFPLMKGETASVFSCFHNGAPSTVKGVLEVKITDKNNKVLSEYNFDGDFTGDVQGLKKDYTAKKDYDWIKLEVGVKDENGNVNQKYEAIYDCNLIKSEKCNSLMENKKASSGILKKIGYIAGILIGFLLIASIIILIKRRKNSGGNGIMKLFIVFAIAGAFFAISKPAEACTVDTVTLTPSTINYDTASNVKWTSTGTALASCKVGWTNGGTELTSIGAPDNNIIGISTGKQTSSKTVYVNCKEIGIFNTNRCSKSASLTVNDAPDCTASVTASSTVNYGTNKTISWSSTNVKAGSCKDINGNFIVASGSWTYSNITSPIDYQLTCENLAGDTCDASGTISVSIPACTVDTVTLGDSSIDYGDSTYVKWTSTNGKNCDVGWTDGGTHLWSNAAADYSGTLVNTGAQTYSRDVWVNCDNVVSGGADCSRKTRLTVAAAIPCTASVSASSSVAYGANKTVSWSSSANAKNCKNIVGVPLITPASFTFTNITSPIDYSLTCENEDGISSDCTSGVKTVSVIPPPACTASVTASSTVAYGANKTISWSSNNIKSGTCKDINGNFIIDSGSWTYSNITSPISYKLTCENLVGDTCDASGTIAITPPDDCTIDSFTSQAPSVDWNNGTFLNWTTTNATDCWLDGGTYNDFKVWEIYMDYPTGTLGSTGNLDVSTGYTLTCQNKAGVTCTGGSKAVNVTVDQPEACTINNFRGEPADIIIGQTTLMKWTTEGVKDWSCRITGEGFSGIIPVTNNSEDDDYITSPLSSTEAYTLTCKNEKDEECSSTTLVNVSGVPFDPGLCDFEVPEAWWSWDWDAGLSSLLHASSSVPFSTRMDTGCVGDGSQESSGFAGIHYWAGMEAPDINCENDPLNFVTNIITNNSTNDCSATPISTSHEPIQFNAHSFGGYNSSGSWEGTPALNIPSFVTTGRGIYLWDVLGLPPTNVNTIWDSFMTNIANLFICMSSDDQDERNTLYNEVSELNTFLNNVTATRPTIVSSNPTALPCDNNTFICTPNPDFIGTEEAIVTISFPPTLVFIGAIRYCIDTSKWDLVLGTPPTWPLAGAEMKYTFNVQGGAPSQCSLDVNVLESGLDINSDPAGISGCNSDSGDCNEVYDTPGTNVTLDTDPSVVAEWLVYDGYGTLINACTGDAESCTIAMGAVGDNDTACSRTVSVQPQPCTVGINANPASLSQNQATDLTWVTTNASGCWGWRNSFSGNEGLTGGSAGFVPLQQTTPLSSGPLANIDIYDFNISCWSTAGSGCSATTLVNVTTPNVGPINMDIIGPSGAYINESVEFGFKATDPNGDNVRYEIDWDNNDIVDAYLPSSSGYVTQGETQYTNNPVNQWPTKGNYTFQARAFDGAARSGWATHTIEIASLPGVCNSDLNSYNESEDGSWASIGSYCGVDSNPDPASPSEPVPGNPSKWICQSTSGGADANCESCKPINCSSIDRNDYCIGQKIPDGCGGDGCGEGTKDCGGDWTETK